MLPIKNDTVIINVCQVMPNLNDSHYWRVASDTQNGSTYNQEQLNRSFAFYIFSYLVLLLLCTVGNIFNLIIFVRDKRRSSANCYMIATAITDLGVLWLWFPLFFWEMSSTLNLSYASIGNYAITSGLTGPVTWGQETCANLADWILVVFSLERLLVLNAPFTYKWLQRPNTAKIIILVLATFSAAFAVHFFVANTICFKRDLWAKPEQIPFWLIQWKSVQEVAQGVVSALVFLLVFVQNLALVVLLTRRNQSEVGKMRMAQSANSTHTTSERYSNLLLLGSAFLFLVSRFPSFVYRTLAWASLFHSVEFDESSQIMAANIADIIFFSYYSFNFFIYLATNEHHRTGFIDIFRSLNKWARNSIS
ncbi:uncharacterized protein LOC129597753 [Paramacrobiotus metropolitanus]|uniref:uncharacterized protein LOC129597753 n=1 Tax=Paramacrobiotus metropolitanus TaxID=2943436 RepID=UPI002445E0F7|nr:uncharacterized protein LOC129597753 [Paramacrobiotus metropolitanus]